MGVRIDAEGEAEVAVRVTLSGPVEFAVAETEFSPHKKTEKWVFTLMDDTEVEKEVYLDDRLQ